MATKAGGTTAKANRANPALAKRAVATPRSRAAKPSAKGAAKRPAKTPAQQRAERQAKAVARVATARAHNPHAYTGVVRRAGVAPASATTLTVPASHSHGGALAPEDYATLTRSRAAGRANSITLHTAAGDLTLRAPQSGAWPDFETTVRPKLEQNFQARYDALRALAAKKSTSKTVGRALAQMTSGDILNLAWKDTARSLGMRYSATRASARAVYDLNLMEGPLAAIKSGAKTQEGRLGSNRLKTVRTGDILHFTSQSGQHLHAEVTRVRSYQSAQAMVRGAGMRALGFDPRYGDTVASAAELYHHIYWMERPENGWLAFGVKPVAASRANEPLTTTTTTTSGGKRGSRKRGAR